MEVETFVLNFNELTSELTRRGEVSEYEELRVSNDKCKVVLNSVWFGLSFSIDVFLELKHVCSLAELWM